MQRSKGFGHRVVVSQKSYVQCTDCAPLWLLQTKLLASTGWKRGCEYFSYRCSHHVTTCLFQDPFPPFRFGIPSIHSLPEAWGSWEPQYAPPILHYACIMPIPSLQLQKKKRVSCREVREAKGLVTELWSPRFVTYNTVIVSKVWVTGYWLCSQLWHVTAANQWNPMNNCRDWQDWDFSIRGLEVGLPAFQLPMFSKCDALPKGDLFDMFV